MVQLETTVFSVILNMTYYTAALETKTQPELMKSSLIKACVLLFHHCLSKVLLLICALS